MHDRMTVQAQIAADKKIDIQDIMNNLIGTGEDR